MSLTRWYAAGCLSLLLGTPGFADDPKASGRDDEAARVELRRLERLADDPRADPDALWKDLVAFRQTFPGTPHALRAAQLMGRVKSPLDRLDPAAIPDDQRFYWQPKGLVAVLGEHNGRHAAEVRRVAFNHDGKLVVSLSNDGVRVWDAQTLREVRWFQDGLSFAVSPDGKTVAVTHGKGPGGSVEPGRIGLYAFGDRRLKERFTIDVAGHVLGGSLAFSPDGRMLAEQSIPPRPPVHQLFDSHRRRQWEAQRSFRFWDVTGSGPVELPRLRLGKDLRSGAFAADGRLWICPADERTLRLWDLSKRPYKEHATLPALDTFTLSPDSRLLATEVAGLDLIKFWDLSGDRPQALTSVPRLPLTGRLRFSRDGEQLFALVGDRLQVWQTREVRAQAQGQIMRAVPQLVSLPTSCWSLDMAPDGEHVVVGGEDGTVRVCNLRTGKERRPPRGHTGPVHVVTFSADGRYLFSGGQDGKLGCWDLGSGQPPLDSYTEKPTDRPVQTLALSPTWPVLVSSGRDRKEHKADVVRCWKFAKGQLSEVIAVATGGLDVRHLAFHANGQWLSVTGKHTTGEGDDDLCRASVEVWQVSKVARVERRDVAGFRGPAVKRYPLADDREDAVMGLVAPDGQYGWLLTRYSHYLRLWRLSGRGDRPTTTSLLELRNLTNFFALSPDGKQLATEPEQEDGQRDAGRVALQIWEVSPPNLRRARQLCFGQPCYVSCLCWSPDGEQIAARDCDDRLVVWQVQSGRVQWWGQCPPGIGHVAFAPDSRHLAVALSGGLTYLIRVVPH